MMPYRVSEAPCVPEGRGHILESNRCLSMDGHVYSRWTEVPDGPEPCPPRRAVGLPATDSGFAIHAARAPISNWWLFFRLHDGGAPDSSCYFERFSVGLLAQPM